MRKLVHHSYRFIQVLLSGTKIHTIREWSCMPETQLVHICNPYSNLRQSVMTNTCTSVEKVRIDALNQSVTVYHDSMESKALTTSEIELLAHNDGFESVEKFWLYFRKYSKNSIYNFNIIHWTDIKYFNL